MVIEQAHIDPKFLSVNQKNYPEEEMKFSKIHWDAFLSEDFPSWFLWDLILFFSLLHLVTSGDSFFQHFSSLEQTHHYFYFYCLLGQILQNAALRMGTCQVKHGLYRGLHLIKRCRMFSSCNLRRFGMHAKLCWTAAKVSGTRLDLLLAQNNLMQILSKPNPTSINQVSFARSRCEGAALQWIW